MIVKKYYKFFIFFLFFVKPHVIQASLVDGVVTLPKQCETCVRLQLTLEKLQQELIDMDKDKITVLYIGENKEPFIVMQESLFKIAKDKLEKLEKERFDLHNRSMRVLLENTVLERQYSKALHINETLKNQNIEALLKNKTLIEKNNTLNNILIEKNKKLEKYKKENERLQYKVRFFEASLVLVCFCLFAHYIY